MNSRHLYLRGNGIALFRQAGVLRAVGVALGAVALLLQVSLFWLPHPAVASSDDWSGPARAIAFLGKGLALCGAGAAPQTHSSVPGKQPLPEKSAACPICLALHLLGSGVPPTGIAVLTSPIPDAALTPGGHTLIAARSLHPTAQPRAPPARLT